MVNVDFYENTASHLHYKFQQFLRFQSPLVLYTRKHFLRRGNSDVFKWVGANQTASNYHEECSMVRLLSDYDLHYISLLCFIKVLLDCIYVFCAVFRVL